MLTGNKEKKEPILVDVPFGKHKEQDEGAG